VVIPKIFSLVVTPAALARPMVNLPESEPVMYTGLPFRMVLPDTFLTSLYSSCPLCRLVPPIPVCISKVPNSLFHTTLPAA
jgi:hypothetical protein